MSIQDNDSSNLASNQFWDLYWNKAKIIKGCVMRPKREALIVGGDLTGPFSKGGECTWHIEVNHRFINISEISIIIHTNGAKFMGKGFQSWKQGGVVDFFFNKKKIYSIECEVQGLFDTYWPVSAPAGTDSVLTQWIRIEPMMVLNGTTEFSIKANPYTAVDIHRVELRVRHPSSQQELLLSETSGANVNINLQGITDSTIIVSSLNKKQSLKIFLCHSSEDKSKVRELYYRLLREGEDPWLDEENLLPGHDWQMEIPKAVRDSDVVIVCLSKASITKEGYVQKEIKQALDVADEKPEGTIFIIPLKLEECNVPERLRKWHWVNLFKENGYQRLMRSLNIRAETKNKV